MSGTRLIHLVAHRGNAREFPENTLPAFQSALDLGVRFLELDVHLARDGTPVVIHDHLLARTTGLPGSVFDLDGAQLAQIEAAETGRFGERHRGTCIPLLRDVLGLLDGRPQVTLFVEIKRQSLRVYGHDEVISRVLEALRPWASQCVVISFDLTAVQHARALGGLPIGWVLPHYDPHHELRYEALRPEFLFCDHAKLPAHGGLRRGPWRWAIYEVDTLPLALELAARGADYLETMAVREMSTAMRALSAAP
ncbi:MAG: glycerophosphodiester phosphodiesterase [Gammaproteobacteria bacterium]|nr:glycerophosphodiester phosphodiesterase [Gammaproteobacteria bacterium]